MNCGICGPLLKDNYAFRKCFGQIADVISFRQSRSRRIWTAADRSNRGASGTILLDERFSSFDSSAGKCMVAYTKMQQHSRQQEFAELLQGHMPDLLYCL